jgi:hypothetical protein
MSSQLLMQHSRFIPQQSSLLIGILGLFRNTLRFEFNILDLFHNILRSSFNILGSFHNILHYLLDLRGESFFEGFQVCQGRNAIILLKLMILWSLLDGFVGFNSVYHFVELNSFHQLT